MNIDRNNYEEFFILYLDNELSADERRSVENFAAANPDLQTELDLLLQSKLVPDNDIVFSGKHELLKQPADAATESMLLYIDNELDPAQKASLEQWIAQNPAAQDELNLLHRAKLQPEHIVFADKDLLYRREERRVVAIRWWRMAAAAALLLAVSTAAFMFNQKRQQDHAMAVTERQQAKTMAETRLKTGDIPSSNPAITITPGKETAESTNNSAARQTEIKTANASSFTAGHSNNDRLNNKAATVANTNTADVDHNTGAEEVAYKVNVRTAMVDNTQPIAGMNLEDNSPLTIQKEIKPLPGVTQEEAQPLDIADQSGKKNRLRGFFRKITRTFEKTTNIKATDGEDRLLVGGLAIKF